MTDDVIVLQPGDERAQKIGKAISSQTAGDILTILSQGPKTASDLTGLLSIPMGTLKYHIDNLLEAGLIEISETRYSVKGREVKVYRLKDQLVIVAPKVTSIRSILLKYASLFVIVVLASLAVLAILSLFRFPQDMAGTPTFSQDGRGGAGMLAEKAPGAEPVAADRVVNLALAFFLGGCMVALLLFLHEAYKLQKGKI
ncbi:MAG TPA: winged helix-turn-helix domain-containing protein [Methanoregulaceae archaeon]|nr:MAG: helix-turn-helix transcriptional regulator [Methanolinea sp.]HON81100.1 winged helix-turn-helix domain-containing protein [Methanoregulaceae archaeon]HPD09956.1 winged helix-turn-helix domain-containing protein [Methanoregulaceae archaeon]HRT14853.1 winged helix-turn-helix domain-containing protein [Methanoregulaceae archaeon]HRU30532.1 winged helix-turn-helix domain-containing protein [Methanoregulaceae archaeon]